MVVETNQGQLGLALLQFFVIVIEGSDFLFCFASPFKKDTSKGRVSGPQIPLKRQRMLAYFAPP